MRTPQEIAEIIETSVKKKGIAVNKLLCDLGYGKNSSLINDMKRRNSAPSYDKLAAIAQYLDITSDYLLGLTDNPAPSRKTITDEERLAAEIFKMSPEKRKNLMQYAEFLKIQQEFSSELSEELSFTGREPLPE